MNPVTSAASARDLSHPEGDWSHHFKDINGIRLHYVREGRGTPVILLHGWPEFWWSWHRTIPALSTGFDIIAPDLRGFGDSVVASPRNSDLAGPATHAADVIALADALGLERFGIVSHDVGAYVAQYIARTTPERLTGLFFFNAPYPGIGGRWVEARHVREIWYQSFNQLNWAARLVGYNRDTCRLFFEGMLRHWTRRTDAFDGQIDFWVDNFMKPGRIEGGFAWYAATHAARMGLVEHGAPTLPKITVPSRFFWGRHDPIILCDWMDRLPDYFHAPIMEVAEDAGHFVHLEVPQLAAAKVAEFFQGME